VFHAIQRRARGAHSTHWPKFSSSKLSTLASKEVRERNPHSPIVTGHQPSTLSSWSAIVIA
jgi:hypothetical protein